MLCLEYAHRRKSKKTGVRADAGQIPRQFVRKYVNRTRQVPPGQVIALENVHIGVRTKSCDFGYESETAIDKSVNGVVVGASGVKD
jgi:hypothetical protein